MIVVKTPFGWVGAALSARGVSRVVLPKRDRRSVERELQSPESGVRRSEPKRSAESPLRVKTERLLEKYFSGERVSFDLSLDLRYYTTFQQAVWKTAATIPYGETRSYGWIAKRIGKEKAARAVGQAMGANPLPIIVP